MNNMTRMTREQFEKIMDNDDKFSVNLASYAKDTALLGLNIIAKYLPNSGVEGADQDIIYGADVNELLKTGLTETDAIELRNLNWMIDDNNLACFV